MLELSGPDSLIASGLVFADCKDPLRMPELKSVNLEGGLIHLTALLKVKHNKVKTCLDLPDCSSPGERRRGEVAEKETMRWSKEYMT